MLFFSLFAAIAHCRVVEYNWSIGWVEGVNPDGFHQRNAIGINGKWPLDPVIVQEGDVLLIHATNTLNESSSLHFHGLFQKGTNYFDGANMISDCGIAPGSTYTYRVSTLDQRGTYWIHGHHAGQYPDGLRFPLIIQDPKETVKYDSELVLSLSDWYHEYYNILYSRDFSNPGMNPMGFEPLPTTPLLNDVVDPILPISTNKTIRLRFVSMATFASFQVWIDNHNMTIIEVDGVETKPYSTNVLTLAPAQRYSVLIHTLSNTDLNYILHYNFDLSMFQAEANRVPENFNPFGRATLLYNPKATTFSPSDPDPDPYLFDDLNLAPLQEIPPFQVDQTIRLDAMFALFNDSVNHGAFNFSVYQFPMVPTFLTTLSTGSNATNPKVYGKYTHSNVLEYQKGIQIILVNRDTEGPHPFHLHGHVFQVVGRGELEIVDSETFPVKYGFDYSVLPPMNNVSNPVRRDTVTVPPNGYAILRFQSDNPGIWLFHCHIQWHIQAGLAATFIEAPLEIQRNQVATPELLDQCHRQNIKTFGNAAGFMDVETFTGFGVPLQIVGS